MDDSSWTSTDTELASTLSRRGRRNDLRVLAACTAAAFVLAACPAAPSSSSPDADPDDGGQAVDDFDPETDEPAGDDGPPPRPAVDEPVTLAVEGDDSCGLASGLTDVQVDLSPGPGPQGGQIGFFGPNGPDPFALTGTLFPGPDGPVWEDRGGDVQDLTDVTIGDGVISGVLDWTDAEGCTETIELTITVPGEVTAWWEVLPPFAPADCTFTGTLTITDGVATFDGVLTDLDGNPVEGQQLTLEIFGHEPGRESMTVTSGAGGVVQATFDAPPGDVSSASVSVVKGAHSLGSTFASGG